MRYERERQGGGEHSFAKGQETSQNGTQMKPRGDKELAVQSTEERALRCKRPVASGGLAPLGTVRKVM